MSLILNHEQAVKLLTDIEDSIDTNLLLFNGVRVWPIIRYFIWQRVINPQQTPSITHKNGQETHAQTPFSTVRKHIGRIVYKQRWKKAVREMGNCGPVQALFLSQEKDHSDIQNGCYINRHIDPMVALCRDSQVQSLKIEMEGNRTFLPRHCPTRYIPKNLFVFPEVPVNTIQNWEELVKVIAELAPGLVIPVELVLAFARDVFKYEALFSDILKSFSPKAVFFACYYSAQSMGLTKAAKGLNIRSVDIQHGKQGRYQGMFNHWSDIPTGGYELLPDYFWAWGEESRHNILDNNSGDIQAHTPIVGGNMWHAGWICEDYYEEPFDEVFASKVESADRIILYSVQPYEDIDTLIPPHVQEAMKQSPKEWLWLIRTHPHGKNKIDEINARLEKLGVTFDIETATNAPLLQLLKIIDAHITGWSSVVYEALAFGKWTILTHERGGIIYRDAIERGVIRLAMDAKALLSNLQDVFNRTAPKESPPFIETSKEKAKKTLLRLLQD